VTARVWTVEELDRVHPEVKRKGWAWALDDGKPFAHLGPIGQVGTITVRIDEYSDGVRELCCERVVFGQDWPDDTVREDPDIDVALAVILASQGRGSFDALADAMVRHRDAAARAESRCRRTKKHARANQHVGKWEAFDLARAMLRRGRVEP
jgi:hypothetical protein